jgi:two-component system response regulator FlrC
MAFQDWRRENAAEIIGESKDLLQVMKVAQRVARTDCTVLITGETGTGKGLAAKAIHTNSPRSEGPFVIVNCGAFPEHLLESELFGYEKGAFTGAEKFKPGKFELADKGTLVLDEIGDMPLYLQAKILRVLQEKEVDRLGGEHTLPIDVRTVSLTNKNIEESIKKKTFREDLFFRLNVIEFNIPPLRERKNDIVFLAEKFLELYQLRESKHIEGFSGGAIIRLKNYDCPGNIRELQNVIQRAIIFCDKNKIDENDIGFNKFTNSVASNKEIKTVSEMEKDLILRTLEKTDNNKSKAAEILGISSRTLRNKLKEYSLNS